MRRPTTHDGPSAAPDPSTAPGRLATVGTWRVWAVTAALLAALAALLFGSLVPAVVEACDAAPPDVRVHTTSEEVADFLAVCGEQGRAAYRQLQLADLVYPAVVGLFLSSSLLLALRRHPRGASLRPLVLLGPLVAVLDYLENGLVWIALTSFPASPASNAMLGLASTAKTVTSWVAWLALLGAVSGATVHRRRQRRAQPTREVAP